MPNNSRLLAYCQLLRLPNVFTAAADVLAGSLIVGAGAELAFPWACLVLSSCLLYSAGMVLNDVYDLEQDAAERPRRPLPSGRINLSAATTLGYALLASGTLAGWLASWQSSNWKPGVIATLLAAAVFGYDRVLKRTPLGPIAMGACRGLNLLLGTSLAAAWGPDHALASLGLFAYITGVTWYARTEAAVSNRLHLAAATAVLGLGVGLMITFAISLLFKGSTLLPFDPASPLRAGILLAVLGAIVARRCLIGVLRPYPQQVQSAVKLAILSLILFDATMCFAVRGPVPAIAVASLLAPTMLLGRWIYST